MKNKSILVVPVVLILIIIGFFAFKKPTANQPVATNTTTTSNNANEKVYCSSDGTLGASQPIQSHRSYCIQATSNTTSYQPSNPSVYSFKVVDDQGNVLKNYDTVHEKIMHFIVVRKDLANFQHVHPDFNPTTGEFSLSTLEFPSDGPYRLFADFTPTSSQMGPDNMKLPVTISQDVNVGNLGNYKQVAIGDTTTTKTFEGYQFALAKTPQQLATGSENKLTFTITQNGKPVKDLEKYLGALGHSVILSEGDLQFIHAHPLEDPTKPQTGNINFMVEFPEAGKYKVFTQFQKNGKVITTDFVVNVIQGSAQKNTPSAGGSMMHQ